MVDLTTRALHRQSATGYPFLYMCAYCLSTRSAVSHGTFFKMADLSDSISNSDESADEGPSNPIAEAKRLGANLSILQRKLK